MEWYERFEFEENPFELDSLKTDFSLIGRDKEAKEILYRIDSGSMLLIEGKAGVGKTALLKYAIDNFKGKGKVVYIDGNKLNKRLNVINLLKKKGMILLMDNVHNLSKKNNERIKFHYDEDNIKAVVFTTTDSELVKFTKAIKERIGNNIIKLKNLSQSNVLKIVKERLGKNELLNEDVLKELYNDSSNLKEFLRNCELLSKYLISSGKQKAEKEDIKKISKEQIEEEKHDTDTCPDCRGKLVKVGEHWRCNICDVYCKKCGALVDYEDLECPDCGIEFEEEK